jgi:hypothetical protein
VEVSDFDDVLSTPGLSPVPNECPHNSSLKPESSMLRAKICWLDKDFQQSRGSRLFFRLVAGANSWFLQRVSRPRRLPISLRARQLPIPRARQSAAPAPCLSGAQRPFARRPPACQEGHGGGWWESICPPVLEQLVKRSITFHTRCSLVVRLFTVDLVGLPLLLERVSRPRRLPVLQVRQLTTNSTLALKFLW